MGKGSKKRKHAQFTEDASPAYEEESALAGVPSILSNIHQSHTKDDHSTLSAHQQDGGGWIRVEKDKKKQRKGSYPALTYAGLHKLQSSIKIDHLQNLVLYCLADGVSPQWISVSSRSAIKKAVVLLVPGLEKAMFDGTILLEKSSKKSQDAKLSDQDPEAIKESKDQTRTDCITSKVANHENVKFGSNFPSPDDFVPLRLAHGEKLPESLKPLADIFMHMWPVRAPGDARLAKVHSPLHAMLTVPLAKSQEGKWEESKNKGGKARRDNQRKDNKRTPITAFVASKEELIENEYTAHPAWFVSQSEQEHEALRRKKAKETPEAGWVDSLVENIQDAEIPVENIEQGSMTAGRTVLAMDCEMCKVDDGEMALTRISIVGWDGEVIMDELVKPHKPIVDYLTPYSGITARKLETTSTRLEDIQIRLLEILNPQTIILGHSLNSDLSALKMTHPFIADTSILYPHPRGPPSKSSLKWLSQRHLSREIQKGHGTHGHDSIEDARACLDLVKLKCERGPKFGGSSESSCESIFKRLARSPKTGVSAANGTEGKLGAIIDHTPAEKNFGGMATFSIGCATDAEVVQGIKRAVLGDPDGSTIPGGGVEFTWARLRDLGSFRGWSRDNHNNSPDGPAPPDQLEEPPHATLNAAVAQTVQHIKSIRDLLPPCTLFVVYSGTGDPREMARLQDMQRRFKREYAVKKWDQLSVKWTDREEQALKKAFHIASEGLGFVGVV